MSWPFLVLACALAAFAVWVLTWAVLRALVRFEVYDRPNIRSSHTRPTPRGGGLALVPVILVSWVLLYDWPDYDWPDGGPPGFWIVVAGAAGLAVVSWLDDLKGLPTALRFALQALAVAAGLAAVGDAGLVFQGILPPLLDRVAAAVAWLWFVNLFNFMDGIDGISGVEAATIGLGLSLVAGLAADTGSSMALPALLGAAALGFLAWNWHPSKLFLGDVGSVPLGYLLGWLLLIAAMNGHWAAAMILPLYYLADATITLFKRALRGTKVWHAHREHFYQRAVQGGASHAKVATQVLACNAVLILCALAATGGYTWSAMAAAGIAVAGLLGMMERQARAVT